MSQEIVVIGAGQAGVQAIVSLRADGFTGPITLIGDEPHLPYQRPPLSKAYLMGKMERARLFLKADNYFPEAGCETILNVSVTAIERDAKQVRLTDGRAVSYDKLLIATGSRVRTIPVPGAELAGIHYLRGIADVDALAAVFHPGKKLAVVGGGYVGLEVAAVAAKHGLDVTVFEAMDRLMARAVTPVVSHFFEDEHRKAGVNLLLKTGVDAFEGTDHVTGVRAGGTVYPADIVLVGIGILPNDELAKSAGLSCRDGILVDWDCSTIEDKSIFAAGDCTRHEGREGEMIRLESVQNAIDQAKHAAAAMLGNPRPYKEVPWFWSDQYDLKLQAAGLARPTDTLVQRGDPATRKFAVFHLRDGMVAAVESVNAAPEYMIGKKLIAENARVAPERLADLSVPMKSLV